MWCLKGCTLEFVAWIFMALSALLEAVRLNWEYSCLSAVVSSQYMYPALSEFGTGTKLLWMCGAGHI